MEVVSTPSFERRFRDIEDRFARSKIGLALRRMRLGNLGDWKSVGVGIMEARIHYGPGYRIYFTRRGAEIVILLLCGDKRTQQADINRAKLLADNL
jgi:putative addiction module killer protein